MANYFQNQQASNNNQSLANTNSYNGNVQNAQGTLGNIWGNSSGSADANQYTAEQATQGVGSGAYQNNAYYNNAPISTYTPTSNGYTNIAQGANQFTGDNSAYTQGQLADTSGLMDLGNYAAGQAGTFVPGGSAAGNTAYGNELNSAVYNNPALGLSQQFQQNYQMTPQEIQGMADQAGRTVGNQFQSSLDTANRSAAAAGMSAMGTNALANRVTSQSAAQSGDAMANARLNAQLAALGVTQQSEAMRLGAAQTSASDTMNAANSQAALGLSGAEAGNQFEQNAGQYIDANLSNRLTASTENQQQYGLQQIASQQGQQAQQFNQQLSGNQAISGEDAQTAALALQQEGLSTQQVIQLLSAQNAGNLTQGQLQTAGTTAAASLQQPSVLQQILGGVTGALGAAGGGAGIAKLAAL